jgi:hypothetical protein
MSDRFQGVWASPYIQKLLFKIAMILLIIGGLNWLAIGLFETNFVSYVCGNGLLSSIVYIFVGVSALTIMFYRDTYLPFLGETLAPCSVLQNRSPPGATKEVKLVITPNTKVLYWAAEPANDNLKALQSWKEAYGKYENAGVATSNGEGVVLLKVRDPQSYKVPFKGKLDAHVHYRVCGEGGFMERVNTVPIYKSDPEGFYENNFGDDASTL